MCGEGLERPELDLHVPHCLWVLDPESGQPVCPMTSLLAAEFSEAYLRLVRNYLSEHSLSGSPKGYSVM